MGMGIGMCIDVAAAAAKAVTLTVKAPNDTAYKRWSCHSVLKQIVSNLPVFWHAGHADPLDGWRCCSQKWVMS